MTPLLAFGLTFPLALMVGAWILWPLDRAARHRRARVQFTVIDFFGLVFLLQLPMALIRTAFQTDQPYDETRETEFLIYGMAWLATAMVWGKCVQIFSRAGVTNSTDRGLTVFLVLPMAFIGTLAIPLLLGHACRFELETSRRALFFTFALLISIGVLVAGTVSRRVTRRAGTSADLSSTLKSNS